MKLALTFAAAAALLAGCGGGGASGGPSIPSRPVPPGSAFTKVGFALNVGPKGLSDTRHTKYVSYSTNGVAIYAVAHGGNLALAPVTMTDVSSGSAACSGATGNPRTCTALSNAPTGNDDFRIVLYDTAPVPGNPPAGNVLATIDLTAGITIVAGQTNTIPIVPNGVINTISLGGVSRLVIPQDGSVHRVQFNVSANDAAGNAIVAPGDYNAPIALGITGDPSGALALSTSSITTPTANGVTPVTVTYDTTKPLASAATITATSPGSTNGPAISVVPLASTPASLTLNSTQTATITVSEPGYGSLFTATSTTPATANVSPRYAAPSTPGGSVTFTVTGGSGGGQTNIFIADATGANVHSAVTVTATGGGVTIPGGPTRQDFTLASGYTPTAAMSFNGNLVVATNNGSTDFIETIDTSGNELTQFSGPQNAVFGIAAGPDGNVWYADENAIATMTPSGSNLRYQTGLAARPSIETITNGADGKLWFSDYNNSAIGSISVTGNITTYPIPNAPYYLALGSDGNIWFTEPGARKFGRITPSGVVTEFGGLSSVYGNITAGADGNLWIAEADSTHPIARITTSGAVTEYPAIQEARFVVSAPDGNIWFASNTSPGLGRITPGGVQTAFAGFPTVYGLAVGPDGHIWELPTSGGRLTRVGP